jgi:hypothetical protein
MLNQEVATAMVPTIEESKDQEASEMEALGFSNDVSDDRNWALDEKVVAQIREEIYDIILQTRSQMVNLHESWRATRRMSTLEHDSNQSYIGRSNAYIPVWARAKKTLVSSLSQGLFPSEDYCDVSSRESKAVPPVQPPVIPNMDPQMTGMMPPPPPPPDLQTISKGVKTYIQWDLEKNAKLRSQFKPFLGELIDHGISVAKVWYEKESARKKPAKKAGSLGAFAVDNPGTSMFREGIRFSTRSIFDWYVYPVTADSLDQATVIFEDLNVPKSYVIERGRKGNWVNIEDALNAPEIPEKQQNDGELAQSKIFNSTNTNQFTSPQGKILMVTEVWTSLVMPKAAYLEDEDNEAPIPVKIVMAGDVVLQCIRNPFWFQKHPYLVSRDDPAPGNFFPTGTGRLARSLQYLVNDFTNQMNDNGNYALNPILKYNPGLLAGPLPPIRPGVSWAMTSMDAVEFERPPIEQTQYGMNYVTMFSGMVGDFTGATPALQGNSAGKNAKTATGMQILQKNAMTPLKDQIEDIEGDVMQPLMFMSWVLAQQFRDGQFLVDMTGEEAILMSKDQLAGDFNFRWLASSQAANQQMRAQQSMSLLQILPGMSPLLQANGRMADPTPLLRRVWTDGFGFRNFDEFIKPLPAQPMLPPGGGGVPPTSPPNALDDGGIRSAVEQSPVDDGQGAEMTGGEGADMAEIRNMLGGEGDF